MKKINLFEIGSFYLSIINITDKKIDLFEIALFFSFLNEKKLTSLKSHYFFPF